MKYVCPVCQTAGDIPENSATPPENQITCHQCGSILIIAPDTGRVKVLQKAPPAPAGEKVSGRRPKYDMTPVLSLRQQDKGRKDYLAIGVFVLVLCVLIATGIYFSLNINRGVLNQPLEMISERVDDITEYAKSIWGRIQKEQQSQNREARQARKHLRKGYDYYKANRLKEALEKLNLAIESNPDIYEAYFWRARTYIRMGQYEEALSDLNRVVDINPRYSPAYDNLGWLFMRRNKFDDSLSNLNKSIELKSDNGWAHYMRGRVYFNKGDLQKAHENATAACNLGYKDGCRDAKRYASELTQNS
ncbi:MAG: tetratricopeptide repeat protein [Desulfobacterales bacterium]|nr:tetratricopeptide repeat protein [Desulfobacterales bacterium]